MASLTKESVVQPKQQQQQQQLGPPPPTPNLIPGSSSAVGVSSQAEDESRKKNTDCVYFLASPLTCKKGSECEYRHSETARLNPRDCWYWMNTVCLNPKCSFRHPPLDGLLGSPAAASAGSSFPPPPAVSSTPYNAPKQAVACIFFQKGYCLKGERCSFFHGSNPANNKVPPTPAGGASEPRATGKAFRGLEKCPQPKIIPHVNAPKLGEGFPVAKAAPKPQNALPRDVTAPVKFGPNHTGSIRELPSKEAVVHVDNGNSRVKSNHAHPPSLIDDPNFQNDRDVDELLRESSPGFDVLVDDDLRNAADYYHSENHFGRISGHEGRNLNELEMGQCDDYNPVADGEADLYHDQRGYESYDRLEERYAWEQRRGSSDRSLREAGQFDRRGSGEDSDLRHRLSKHRRNNGLRSVVSPDYAPKRHSDERSYQNARKDSHHSPSHEGALRSRLQGRIKLPRRSPVNGSVERETDRGRSRGRLSPSKPQLASHQGRLRDRLRGRVPDDLIEGNNSVVPRMRRDTLDDYNPNFAAPKSLAELKVAKQSHGRDLSSKHTESALMGKRRYSPLEGSQVSEADMSFEGPKPLSEILKRKREVGSAVVSCNKGEDNQNENEQPLVNTNSGSVISTQESESKLPDIASAGESESVNVASVEDNKSVIADGDALEAAGPSKKIKITDGVASQSNDINSSEKEEGVIEDGVEYNEHEMEEYDQGDGEYEYEQDGEGYTLEEGKNAYAEEDFMEEDDGEDFAKKIGVMFS